MREIAENDVVQALINGDLCVLMEIVNRDQLTIHSHEPKKIEIECLSPRGTQSAIATLAEIPFATWPPSQQESLGFVPQGTYVVCNKDRVIRKLEDREIFIVRKITPIKI